MELLRAVVVVVAVLLLLKLVVGLATCAAGRSRSVVDEVLAAVKEEAGQPPVGLVAPRRPDALQRYIADGGQGRAAQDDTGDVAQ